MFSIPKLILAFGAVFSIVSSQPATWTTCCGSSDSECIIWSNVTFTPPTPIAGQTMIVNGTGNVRGIVNNGTGQVNAYLYGVNVFNANTNTCGESQIDVLGITTGILDALNCPTQIGSNVTLGFVLPIPDEAQGLGQLNITLNSTDQTGNTVAFCLDIVATV